MISMADEFNFNDNIGQINVAKDNAKINAEQNAGSKYNISGGNIGAVGDNAKAENIIQYANNSNIPSIEINMDELLEELVKLRKELKNVLQPNETYILGDIKNAIDSANNEDKNQVVNSLKKAKDIITPYVVNFGLSYLAGLLPKIV
jgi:type III secretion system FlhB-like substrate exporter